MRIGELSERTGVSVQALRFYERRGLITPPVRSDSGYRVYAPSAVREVRAIKWAQGLGFRLEELVEVMRILRDHERRRTGVVRARARVKIEEIDGTIRRLQTMRRSLRAIVACRCNGHCPIIEKAIGERRRR